MKLLKLIFCILFLAGCHSNEAGIIKNDVQTVKKEPLPLKTMFIPERPAVFNGLIEDFEQNLFYWDSAPGINGQELTLDREAQNSIGVFRFQAVYSADEYSDRIIIFQYKRKMDFSRFRGIRFLARGTPEIQFKIRIYEKENYLKDTFSDEIWYKIFKVKKDWIEHRIPFYDLQVEEYYEQDYISDTKQVFTNIAGIGISARNFSRTETIPGELYLDNISLY
ncbi:MAG: carbohydrate binding domain-containing protein [bacterium]|nr:carbohydrate binding domain-containing protein [bacterium]